jgi:hypothetical protein
MRRLFSVWNRGYKTMLIIAASAPEALQIATESRHIKRPDMYRKFSDATDEALAQDDEGTLAKALNADKSGVASHVEGDGWYIGTEKVS